MKLVASLLNLRIGLIFLALTSIHLLSHSPAIAQTRTHRRAQPRSPAQPPNVTSTQTGDKRGFDIMIKVEDGKLIRLYDASYALVIGVSDYGDYKNGWPTLPGVKSDVSAVRAVLEKQGFNVIVVMNPNGVQLANAFKDFINHYGLQENNRLLFYFAGHGHTMKQSYGEEMGYIVPVDAPHPNRDIAGFRYKAIDMQMMEQYARMIQSKHALFIFDSCFSGSLFALARAVPDSIKYKTAKPVRQFITSGSADELVPDKSIFRQQFIAGLEGEADSNGDGYVTGTELGEFLQDQVVNYSRNSQHPQYGKIRHPYLDKGDFVFALPKAVTAANNNKIIGQPAPNSAIVDDSEPLQPRPASHQDKIQIAPVPGSTPTNAGSPGSGELAKADVPNAATSEAALSPKRVFAGGEPSYYNGDPSEDAEKGRIAEIKGKRKVYVYTKGETYHSSCYPIGFSGFSGLPGNIFKPDDTILKQWSEDLGVHIDNLRRWKDLIAEELKKNNLEVVNTEAEAEFFVLYNEDRSYTYSSDENWPAGRIKPVIPTSGDACPTDKVFGSLGVMVRGTKRADGSYNQRFIWNKKRQEMKRNLDLNIPNPKGDPALIMTRKFIADLK